MYQKILLPLDASPNSESAIPTACEMIRQFEAELHLLVAYDLGSALFLGKEDKLPVDIKKLKEHQRKQVEGYLQGQAEALKEQGIPVRWAARAEDARESICKYAAEQEIDLIIMNSQGRSGWMRWLTGSIAEEVLRHAPCPVLVVRQTTPAEE